MIKALKAANINTQISIGVLYAKSFNHSFTKNHAIGEANKIDTKIRRVNSEENSRTNWLTLAPKTFLIPNSFNLCSAEKAANPNIHA